MKIQTKCPQCGKTFKVENEYVGRKGKCPACQATFVVAQNEDLVESQVSPEPQCSPPEDPISNSASVVPAIRIDRSHAAAGGIGAVCGVMGTLFVAYIIAAPKSVDAERKQATGAQPSEIQSRAAPDAISVKPVEEKLVDTKADDAKPVVKPKPEPIQIEFETRPFQHKFDIKRRDDKFTKKASLSLHAAVDGEIWLDLFSVGESVDPVAPETVIFGFTSRTISWRFLKFHDLKLLIDGSLMDLGNAKHAGDVLSGGVRESMDLHIDVSVLSKIANAKKIEVQLGTAEFALADEHLEAMRDFASRLPTGQTELGTFVITHKPRQ